MFYSHEILTSSEHGVATIWLVATLGSKSVSRKLNRRTILDVNVPKACGIIMDPVAPMALRLQGNLLYGVSRVYSQQCGYTLTDVQAMHDRMRTMLHSMPSGGLDPAAGKIRPDHLILPYDPSFLPENNLPGLGLDLSRLDNQIEGNESQLSGSFWPHTPDLSQSALSSTASLQLNLPTDDNIFGEIGGPDSITDVASSAQKSLDFGFGGLTASTPVEDAGVLFQPDFEFDEDGNLIELGAIRRTRPGNEVSGGNVNDDIFEDQPIFVAEDIEIDIGREEHLPAIRPHTPNPNRSSMFEHEVEMDLAPEGVAMRQRQRVPRFITSDTQVALQHSELAHMNEQYVQNMATVLKQKWQNKATTQAKKNGAYWVFGLGIGSVGNGVGSSLSPAVHPLSCFSGHELYESLDTARQVGEKRTLEGGDLESSGRRVRARGEGEITFDGDRIQREEDVEIGRHAPPALNDDNSSQMPWNITASIRSSRQGSSAAKIYRGLGNISDLSSHGIPGSIGPLGIDLDTPQLVGVGRSRSRLTSASPLAGRGFSYGVESLTIPGWEDDGVEGLDDIDLNHYLETDAMADVHLNENVDTTASYRSQPDLQNSFTESVMDEESLNFLDFLAERMQSLQVVGGPSPVPIDAPHDSIADSRGITFSALLPPQTTSRRVATQGLMHILALATKGFLSVHQGAYEDQSNEEHGVRYKYGEISLHLSAN